MNKSFLILIMMMVCIAAVSASSDHPNLNANIVNSNPVKIYPGDIVTLSVSIANSGEEAATAVSATLSSDNTIIVLPSHSFSYMPIIPSKQNALATFSIEVPKGITAQDYSLELKITYKDEDDDSRTKELSIPITIESKARFETYTKSVNKLYLNTLNNEISVNLKNIGSARANQIKVQLQPQFPFTTDGSIKYVSSLAAGEDQDVKFVVNVDKSATVGTYALDVIVYYKDDQGNILQDTSTTALIVSKEDTMQKIFVDKWYFWVFGELILAIILLRVAKKKKEA